MNAVSPCLSVQFVLTFTNVWLLCCVCMQFVLTFTNVWLLCDCVCVQFVLTLTNVRILCDRVCVQLVLTFTHVCILCDFVCVQFVLTFTNVRILCDHVCVQFVLTFTNVWLLCDRVCVQFVLIFTYVRIQCDRVCVQVMLAVEHFNKDHKKGFQFLQVSPTFVALSVGLKSAVGTLINKHGSVHQRSSFHHARFFWQGGCISHTRSNKTLVTSFLRLFQATFLGLARTIYIRCVYGNFSREITKYSVIYGVYIRFWPTLHFSECITVPCCTYLDACTYHTHL